MHVRRISAWTLVLGLTACGPTPVTNSDGGLGSDCALYCQGMYHCINTPSARCTLSMSEAAFRADCESACATASSTMSALQVTQAVDCLHCLDGYVDQSSCVATGVMDSGSGSGLIDAVVACTSTCMNDGVTTINARMSAAVLTPDAGRYVCGDAGF